MNVTLEIEGNREDFESFLKNSISKDNYFLLLKIKNFKYLEIKYKKDEINNLSKKIIEKLKSEKFNSLIYNIYNDKIFIVPKSYGEYRDINSLIENILSSFEEPIKINNHFEYIEPIIGVTKYSEKYKNLEDILSQLVISAHYSEEYNKRYTFFSNKIKEELEEEHILYNELINSVKNPEKYFFPVFQPQIDSKSQKITGLEMLLRWNSNINKEYSISKIINLANKKNLLFELDLIALKYGILYKKRLEEKGYNLNFSFNITASNLNSLYVDKLEDLIDKYKIDTNKLDIEITETNQIPNFEYTKKILSRLEKYGINIHIDDFGVNCSNFYELKKLDGNKVIDTLKIDKEFVDDIIEESKFFESILYSAERLGYKVIVEGVETKDQIQKIEIIKDLIYKKPILYQGYYFSKPLKYDELIRYIKEN